MNVVLQ